MSTVVTNVRRQLAPMAKTLLLRCGGYRAIRTIAGALDKSEDAIKANLYRMRRAIAEAAPGLEQILQA